MSVRVCPICDIADCATHRPTATLDPADRIEQLNERLTAATDDAKEAEAYAEQLEAKLTKAVETLRPFADVLKSNYFHQPDTLPISMGFGHYDRRWTLKLMDFRNARTVLAELEGNK
jgi:ABC-type transporter Mla subunit MlaD